MASGSGSKNTSAYSATPAAAAYALLPVMNHLTVKAANSSTNTGVTVFISGKKHTRAGVKRYSTAAYNATRSSPNRSRASAKISKAPRLERITSSQGNTSVRVETISSAWTSSVLPGRLLCACSGASSRTCSKFARISCGTALLCERVERVCAGTQEHALDVDGRPCPHVPVRDGRREDPDDRELPGCPAVDGDREKEESANGNSSEHPHEAGVVTGRCTDRPSLQWPIRQSTAASRRRSRRLRRAALRPRRRPTGCDGKAEPNERRTRSASRSSDAHRPPLSCRYRSAGLKNRS